MTDQDYVPDTDRNGVPCKPGDRVSFKTYPRGTARGVVIISPRALAQHPNGTWGPALAIRRDPPYDDSTYAFHSGGVLRLKNQKRK